VPWHGRGVGRRAGAVGIGGVFGHWVVGVGGEGVVQHGLALDEDSQSGEGGRVGGAGLVEPLALAA
jgi:hypothetical protein